MRCTERVHVSTTSTNSGFTAAPEIDLDDNSNLAGWRIGEGGKLVRVPMSKIRIMPASPSYFTSKPQFTDQLLELEAVLRKYATLPTVPSSQAPRVTWKTVTSVSL